MEKCLKHTDFEEDVYREVLEGRCRLVGDAWFPSRGCSREKKDYLKSYTKRVARNFRRRKRRSEIRAEEFRRLERLTDRARRILAGSFISTSVERHARYVASHHPFETGILPSELWLYLLLLDLIQLLDRMVMHIWRELRSSSRRSPSPQVEREMQKWAQQLTHGNVRPGRRTGAAAPIDTLHRLACERRKLLCRATVARQPTATDLRVAWHFRNRSHANRLRLGCLMMDLECFVDNSLYGKFNGKNPKIDGRSPGIRGWLRDNCPELLPKYFTLMRLKGLARRVQQSSRLADPVPTSALLDTSITAADLLARDIHLQPRGLHAFCRRFPWEIGERKVDHQGRTFLTNEGYRRISWQRPPEENLARLLTEARETLGQILAAAQQPPASPRHHANAAVHLFKEVARLVAKSESWWRGPLRDLD